MENFPRAEKRKDNEVLTQNDKKILASRDSGVELTHEEDLGETISLAPFSYVIATKPVLLLTFKY